ncbi:MAG: 50S ribosomal protein L35 [Proteobacteria bacterium SW_6_67_9]|nr:MAG: 50S ribosomal protein L35 [Proteobacteria bacterium SW_6_67_9]
MPKMKNHRGAAKRFGKTASGRYKHKQSNFSHLLTKKDAKRKRKLRDRDVIEDQDSAAVRRMLPYV